MPPSPVPPRHRIAAVALLAASACAHAAPVQFGARTLEIPAPQGYVPAASPELHDVSAAYLPPGNRLVEIYVTADDAVSLQRGEGAAMRSYFQLQVLRSIDGKPISSSDFSANVKQVEDAIRSSMPTLEQQTGEMAAQGNATAKESLGVDPALSLGPATFLGAFRREPWATFFTIAMTVSGEVEGRRTSNRVVGASALLIANHQVLYLYAYNAYDGEADRQWAERSVSAWADAVRRANPDDPQVAKSARSGGVFDGVARGALIGGAVGLLVALFGAALRRRKT